MSSITDKSHFAKFQQIKQAFGVLGTGGQATLCARTEPQDCSGAWPKKGQIMSLDKLVVSLLPQNGDDPRLYERSEAYVKRKTGLTFQFVQLRPACTEVLIVGALRIFSPSSKVNTSIHIF